MRLEDADLVARIKARLAPDGGAEREHNAGPGSLGFGTLHYALVTNLRPERALVIGSRYGFVPGVIALALKANGAGCLDFVDAGYSDAADGFVPAYGGVGHWGSAAGDTFAPLGVEDVIAVHVMRSQDFFARCHVRYGYVYIDGDHSYDGCRHDVEQAMAVCEPEGFIVLHDVAVTDPRFGVHRVFAEVDSARYAKLLVPTWPGLGILQRRGEAA
jgi:hypothetical protein